MANWTEAASRTTLARGKKWHPCDRKEQPNHGEFRGVTTREGWVKLRHREAGEKLAEGQSKEQKHSEAREENWKNEALILRREPIKRTDCRHKNADH